MRTQFICLALAIVLICPFASAQWVQTNGPYGASIRCIAVAGSDLFAATGDAVYLSTNNGASWRATSFAHTWVNTFAVGPDSGGTMKLFAGTGNGDVYLPSDRGASWLAVNNGLTTTGNFIASINALLFVGPNLYAGANNDANGGVYLSTNNGASWTAVNNGLGRTSISCLASNGSTLFAGKIAFDWRGDGGVYRSTNNGSSWDRASNGLADSANNPYTVYALAASGGSVLAATWGGVFISTDDGRSWRRGGNVPAVRIFVVSDTNIFAGTSEGGVYLSTDNGASWTAVNSGIQKARINALAVSPASSGAGAMNLFAGADGQGVFLSTNNGTSWRAASSGLTDVSVRALTVFPTAGATGGTNLFAGTSWDVLLSTNNSTSWSAVNAGLTGTYVNAFAVSGANLFAATGSVLGEGLWEGGGGVFLSSNNGTSWTAVNAGLTNLNVKALAVSGTNLFAGTYGGGAFFPPIMVQAGLRLILA